MALIECRECGKRVSSNAENCPNCGNPIKKSGSITGSLFGGFLLGCVAVIILIIYMVTKTAERITDIDEKISTPYSQGVESKTPKSLDAGKVVLSSPRSNDLIKEVNIGEWITTYYVHDGDGIQAVTAKIASNERFRSYEGGDYRKADFTLTSRGVRSGYVEVGTLKLFDCPENGCTVGIKFDRQQAITYEAETDQRLPFHLKIKSNGEIEKKIAASKKMFIYMKTIGGKVDLATFDVDGLDFSSLTNAYKKKYSNATIENHKEDITKSKGWLISDYENPESGISYKSAAISSENLVKPAIQSDSEGWATFYIMDHSISGHRVVLAYPGDRPYCNNRCEIKIKFDDLPYKSYQGEGKTKDGKQWIEVYSRGDIELLIESFNDMYVVASYENYGNLTFKFNVNKFNINKKLAENS